MIGQLSKPAPRGPRRVFPGGPVMELQGSGTSLLGECITKTSQRRRAVLQFPFGEHSGGSAGAGGASFRDCLNLQSASSPEPPPGPSVKSAWPRKHEELSANEERGRAANKQEEVRIVDIP